MVVNSVGSRQDRYNFSLEIPTQAEGSTLIIEQSGQVASLTISLKSRDGQVRQLDKRLIDGLLKIDLVPKEFFDKCRAKVTAAGSENKVYLCQKGEGGMLQVAQTQQITITGIPHDSYQITDYYREKVIIDRVTSLKQSGEFTLGDVVEYLKSGADAVNIAYLAGRRLPECGVRLSTVKDQYASLVAETAGQFIEMQTNNIIVIQKHMQAAKYAAVGQLQNALNSLAASQEEAKKNEAACETLLALASKIRTDLTACKKKAEKTSVALTRAESVLDGLNKEIEETRNRIQQAVSTESDELEKMNTAEAKERRAKLWNALTLGIYGAVGGQTNFHPEIHEQKRKDFYKNQLRLRELESKKIQEMHRISTEIAEKIGSGLDSRELAEETISMALIGLDEVTSAIDYYKNFMRDINKITTTAKHSLQNLVEMGENFGKADVLTDNHINIFTLDFKNSVYNWISLASLGNTCQQSLCNTQQVIQDRLRLKDIEPSQQLARARQEVGDLQVILGNRKRIKDGQMNHAQLLLDDPQQAEAAAVAVTVTLDF